MGRNIEPRSIKKGNEKSMNKLMTPRCQKNVATKGNFPQRPPFATDQGNRRGEGREGYNKPTYTQKTDLPQQNYLR